MMSNKSIVIDNGSSVIKAGFSGENEPSIKFPNIVGIPLSDFKIFGHKFKNEYIGDEAIKMRGYLKLL